VTPGPTFLRAALGSSGAGGGTPPTAANSTELPKGPDMRNPRGTPYPQILPHTRTKKYDLIYEINSDPKYERKYDLQYEQKYDPHFFFAKKLHGTSFVFFGALLEGTFFSALAKI